jgi:ribosomal protein L40E/TM2 domain-containing membrane protein YozV
MGIQTSGQGTGAGSGAVRCPDCGGLNPVGAKWCGQCLRQFGAPPPPPPPPPPAPVTLLESRPASAAADIAAVNSSEQAAVNDYIAEVSDLLAPADQTRPAADPLGVDPLGLDPLGIEKPVTPGAEEHIAPVVPLASHVRAPELSSSESAATWTCRMCETPNPLSADTCAVCGSTFSDTMRPPEPQVVGDPNQAALYSLFFPGAGHAYIGQWGQAVARAIMSAWVLLVTAFLLFGASGGSNKVFAAVFALVATALWLAAAHDAFREASGQQSLVILQGRRYLYVTGTLMGLLFLMLLAGAVTATA